MAGLERRGLARAMTLAVVALSILTAAQGAPVANDALPEAKVLADLDHLVGRTITVQGTVGSVAEDGLLPKTFLVILEGGLRCRLTKDQVGGNTGKWRWGRNVGQVPAIMLDGAAVFAKGERVTLRGLLKLEMKHAMLDQAALLKSSNKRIRVSPPPPAGADGLATPLPLDHR